MTELETMLMKSLQKLMRESEQREHLLQLQLSKLSEQVEKLSTQVEALQVELRQ